MIATIILLTLLVGRFFYELALHGKKEEVKYRADIRLIAVIIMMVLYYYAGLFDRFLN